MNKRVTPKDIKFDYEHAPDGSIRVTATVTFSADGRIDRRFARSDDAYSRVTQYLRRLVMMRIYGDVWELAEKAAGSLFATAPAGFFDREHPTVKALAALRDIGRPDFLDDDRGERVSGLTFEEAADMAELAAIKDEKAE